MTVDLARYGTLPNLTGPTVRVGDTASLTICIPTYNRSRVLAHCLANLPAIDCEVLVSDNASDDRTALVVAECTDPRIRYIRQPENLGPFANRIALAKEATGDLITYLADDDSILVDPLRQHVAAMTDEPDLVATYCDSIAWDDNCEMEMHRYYGDAKTTTFDNDPIELVKFLLTTMIPPEQGIFRRKAMVEAQVLSPRALPFHICAYSLSRLGKVRFDRNAFYREHRVLKPGLVRTDTWNMNIADAYIGDEQRLGLEVIAYRAAIDAGATWNGPELRNAIDRMLLARTELERRRAIERGQDDLAYQLEARLSLWQR